MAPTRAALERELEMLSEEIRQVRSDLEKDEKADIAQARRVALVFLVGVAMEAALPRNAADVGALAALDERTIFWIARALWACAAVWIVLRQPRQTKSVGVRLVTAPAVAVEEAVAEPEPSAAEDARQEEATENPDAPKTPAKSSALNEPSIAVDSPATVASADSPVHTTAVVTKKRSSFIFRAVSGIRRKSSTGASSRQNTTLVMTENTIIQTEEVSRIEQNTALTTPVPTSPISLPKSPESAASPSAADEVASKKSRISFSSRPKTPVAKIEYGAAANPAPADFVYVPPDVSGTEGHLTPVETKALEELEAIVEKDKYTCKEIQQDIGIFRLDRQCLLRFLRARKFNVPAASKMLRNHLEWRDKYVPASITPQDLSKVLGIGMVRFGPYSKDWLPVTMVKVGSFDPAAFTIDDFHKFVAYFFERAAKYLPKGAEKGMLFFDLRGWSIFKHGTPHAMRLTAALVDIIQAHNPERLERCFIFGAPRLFSGTWKVISAWLDPVVVNKIQFVQNMSTILDVFDVASLPSEYGGERVLPYPIEGLDELEKCEETPAAA